jgi:nitric oxide reductase subunit C
VSGIVAARFGVQIRRQIINNRAIFMTLCLAFIPYSAYVYTRGTETPHIEPMNDEARYGQELFQEHNCIACHQFYGLGGYMGPDLTNVASNKGSAYARAFLMSGTQRMPNFDLNDQELDAMVAFLEFVDSTGRYPAEEYRIRWFGTVVQND